MTSTSTAPTAAAPGLAESVRAKLAATAHPLKLAEVLKGLPKPKKARKEELEAEVRAILDAEVHQARLFLHPSGKGGEARYWHHDEKRHLQEKALGLAATPLALNALRTKLAKEVKGVDAAFVEAVVREMVGDDLLFEHPSKTKAGGPLFGATPPPPALETDRHKKAVAKLVGDCEKLLKASGATADALLRMLQQRLTMSPTPPERPVISDPPTTVPDTLTDLILKAVANSPVVSLAELRREMPTQFQGRVFDETVFELFDAGRVTISQDADPMRYTPEERAAFVQDGDVLFTTITRRS